MDGSRNISFAVKAAAAFAAAALVACIPMHDLSAKELAPAKGSARRVVDLSHKRQPAPAVEHRQQAVDSAHHAASLGASHRMIPVTEKSEYDHAPTGYVAKNDNTDEPKLGPDNKPHTVELRQSEGHTQLVSYGDKKPVPDGTRAYLKGTYKAQQPDGSYKDVKVDGVYEKRSEKGPDGKMHDRLVPCNDVKYTGPHNNQGSYGNGDQDHQYRRQQHPQHYEDKHDEGHHDYQKPEVYKPVKNYMDHYFQQHPEKKEVNVECTCQEKNKPPHPPRHYVIKKEKDHCDVYEKHEHNREEKVGTITKTGEFVSVSAGGSAFGGAFYSALGVAAQSGNYQFFDLSKGEMKIDYTPPPSPPAAQTPAPQGGSVNASAGWSKFCTVTCEQIQAAFTDLHNIAGALATSATNSGTMVTIAGEQKDAQLRTADATEKMAIATQQGVCQNAYSINVNLGTDKNDAKKTLDACLTAINTGDKPAQKTDVSPLPNPANPPAGGGGGTSDAGTPGGPGGGTTPTGWAILGGIVAAIAGGLAIAKYRSNNRVAMESDGNPTPDPVDPTPRRNRMGAAINSVTGWIANLAKPSRTATASASADSSVDAPHNQTIFARMAANYHADMLNAPSELARRAEAHAAGIEAASALQAVAAVSQAPVFEYFENTRGPKVDADLVIPTVAEIRNAQQAPAQAAAKQADIAAHIANAKAAQAYEIKQMADAAKERDAANKSRVKNILRNAKEKIADKAAGQIAGEAFEVLAEVAAKRQGERWLPTAGIVERHKIGVEMNQAGQELCINMTTVKAKVIATPEGKLLIEAIGPALTTGAGVRGHAFKAEVSADGHISILANANRETKLAAANKRKVAAGKDTMSVAQLDDQASKVIDMALRHAAAVLLKNKSTFVDLGAHRDAAANNVTANAVQDASPARAANFG